MTEKNNVLIIGNGGREHAIALKLKESDKVGKLYCAKGNAGIGEIAELVDIDPCDIEGICAFVDSHPDIKMTVVAPDDPLALGMVDELEKRGHRAFGPKRAAAQIEASKAFAKALMKKYGIPTAKYEVFESANEAIRYIEKGSFPVVVKADGLALGKGVIICSTLDEAKAAVKSMMLDGVFGKAGSKIVVEEYLEGKELTLLTFTDGETVYPMVSSCDHKRALDNDMGLNTGGMGTIAPCPFLTKEMEEEIKEKIVHPTVKAMKAEGAPFKGVLYFGLMATKDGVKVIEHNARFGDPETQVVLPLLESDLYDIFDKIIDGRLKDIDIKWRNKSAVCVILASGGYPEAYEKGKVITIGEIDENCFICHAGTRAKDGKLITNGGRVLGACAVADTLSEAIEKAYATAGKVHFEKMHYRKDIGKKYLG